MRLEDVLSRLREILDLLRAEDYYRVAANPRFRAVERRQTWHASRAAMLVVVVAAPIHIVALSLLHPADASYIVLLDGAIGVGSLAAWWALGRRLRHRPEAVVFVITLGVAAIAMLLAVSGPQVVELTVGYLLFLPILVALLMPWRAWTEARWLTVYGILTIVFFASLLPSSLLVADDRRDVIFALLVALSSAFTGHVLAFRQRVRTFAQVRALGRLQRRETRQRAELERVHHSLEITARLDELTGTGNRIKLHEDLRTARGHLNRTGVSFGMLEVDLDHFKAINDAFGHLAGDEVLRLAAAAMRDALRTDDAVYRYGGEEFIILLGTVKGGVLEAGERLRHAVEALQIAHPGNPPFGLVTVSVGAAVIGPSEAARTNDEWFAGVDAALYQAKADGRNRVGVALSPAPAASLASTR
jgi:diguanylate cyclase (GGDEF)-like protein